MNTSVSKKSDLINSISRIIGTNYIKIQVLATQKKRLQLGLLRAKWSEVSKFHTKSNLIGKQDPYLLA